MLICALRRYLAACYELGKRAIHINHAFGRAGLDDGVYLVGALLANEIRNGFVVDEKFKTRDAAAGDARDKPLRENAGERCRELEAYLVLLPARKRIDNAID